MVKVIEVSNPPSTATREVVGIEEKLLECAEILRASLSEILRTLPEMQDQELFRTAAYACKLELQGFLLRGACAAELRRRFSTKLAGGRGRRDEAREGMQARMEMFAD